jgi:hypothetical protein
VIGDVINFGKKKYWGVPGMHYHRGMAAGDNTLNALCARVVLRSILENGGRFSTAAVLAAYVTFMTTPGSHDDTYAESFHRIFFANYAAGRPPVECSGQPNSYYRKPPASSHAPTVCDLLKAMTAITLQAWEGSSCSVPPLY